MLVQQSLVVTLNGSVNQFSSTGIFSPNVLIQADASNAGDVYIACSTTANAAPSNITAANAAYILAPGESVQLNENNLAYWTGEMWILSHWYAKGTASDVVRVSYTVRRTSATPS